MQGAKLQIPDRKVLEKIYLQYAQDYEHLLRSLEQGLRAAFKEHNIAPTVKGRIKTFESFYQKKIELLRQAHLHHRESAIPITDLIALRVICPFLDDVTMVQKVIASVFVVTENEHKGADRSFSEFGYESIHLLIKIPEMRLSFLRVDDVAKFENDLWKIDQCEIQVRTTLQEAWAEVEHELVYKADFIPVNDMIRRRLAALNANLFLADITFQEIREYEKRLSHELNVRRESFYTKIEQAIDLPFIKAPEPEHNRQQILKTVEEEMNSESIDNLLIRALEDHNKSDYMQAIATYSLLLNKKLPKNARAIIHKHRGMAYFSESLYPEALEDFKISLELDQSSYKAAYFMGVIYSVTEDYTSAIKAFDIALAINPYQYFSLYRRAQAYWHLGDYPQVIADCEASLKLEPHSQQARSLRTMAQEKLADQ